MQTLGLSDSTPRTESRLKALLWPSIRNDADLDYVTTQGFWICVVVSLMTMVQAAMASILHYAILDVAFYFLAALGVRQKSLFAASAAFACYFLASVAAQLRTGRGFGVLNLVFLALLLANVRGIKISRDWKNESGEPPPLRLSETLLDKFADVLPIRLWPRIRKVFYVLAVLEMILLPFALLAPAPPAR